MTEIARRKEQALVNRAHELERGIRDGIKAIRTAWAALAGYLYEFHEERAWELLSYESLDEFLASPEVGMKRAHYYKLVELHRELVVVRGVSAPRLAEVDASKAMEVLPAIRRGDVTPDEGLDDARVLGLRDLREKYRSDPNAPIDPDAEPIRVSCPTCGSAVAPNRLQGGRTGGTQ